MIEMEKEIEEKFIEYKVIRGEELWRYMRKADVLEEKMLILEKAILEMNRILEDVVRKLRGIEK
jgi:hypothetical protein